jgi:hypothetical protein
VLTEDGGLHRAGGRSVEAQDDPGVLARDLMRDAPAALAALFACAS